MNISDLGFTSQLTIRKAEVLVQDLTLDQAKKMVLDLVILLERTKDSYNELIKAEWNLR